MDENKENSEELENTDKLSEEEKDKVGEILESLKDNSDKTTGVQDWEGLVNTTADEEEIIDEETVFGDVPEESEFEDEDEDEEIPEDELCILCGERRRYTEIDENYMYCKVCREKMRKTHMNFWGVLSFIAVFVVCFIGAAYGYVSFSIGGPVFKGDGYFKKGNYTSAINSYVKAEETLSTVNEQFDAEILDLGIKTKEKIIKSYIANDNLGMISNYVDSFSSLNDLDKRKVSDAMKYVDLYNDIMETDESFSREFNDVFNKVYSSNGKMTVDDIKDTIKKIDTMKKDKKYNSAVLSYYEYLLCTMVTGGEEYQEKYLLELKKAGTEYSFIYSSTLCGFYLTQGKYEQAEKECKEALERNPENLSAYQYLMISARRQKKYGIAIGIAEEVTKLANKIYTPTTTDSEGNKIKMSALPDSIPMETAICYALKNDMKSALTAIEEAYSINQQSNDTLNIYMMLHYLAHVDKNATAKDGEKVDTVDGGYDNALYNLENLAMYYSQYFYISDNIQAIMDGEKTLEDVFVNGEVEW